MTKHIITNETMQADHRAWLEAHGQWREDIERWQAEHETAVVRLTKLLQIVREHGECLEEHARALDKIDEAIRAHDREIADQEAGTSKVPPDAVATQHQEQEGVFERQKDAHERIKKHHEGVMAQLQALEASAEAAM
jgi:hypothetical protein